MNFIGYNAKGEIVSCGSCEERFLPHYETDDVSILPSSHEVRPGTHYVDLSGDPVILPIPSQPGPWYAFDYITHEWVMDIESARASAAGRIDAACAAHIVSGFESSALGTAHHYPAKPTDQQNLASSVLASLLPIPTDWTTPFWCADTSGVWAFRLHTAAQIQQVGQDAKAAIFAAMGKNEVLQAQIAAAGSVEELEAIAFGQWRANVWAYGYAELDKVIAGTRPVPTIAEILAELPSLVLP